MSYLAFALILFAFGAVLLIGEYFFAAHGVLLVAAVLCFFAAVGVVGMYGSTLELAVAAAAGLVAVPLGTYGAVIAWKKLFGGEPSPAAEASIAEMPELASLAALRGRIGKTISMLRPSGIVEFDDVRIDALSEGPMIDAGTWVKCVDVKPGKVIVRTVEPDAEPVATAPTNPIDEPASATPPLPSKPLDLNTDDWKIG
jgi:membrane-bound serine protease (ClpP class)